MSFCWLPQNGPDGVFLFEKSKWSSKPSRNGYNVIAEMVVYIYILDLGTFWSPESWDTTKLQSCLVVDVLLSSLISHQVFAFLAPNMN